MDDADSTGKPRERTEQQKKKDLILDDLIKMLSGELGISPTDITEDLDLTGDLPLDSLKLYELVIDLEEAYDIRITDEALDRIHNIDDLVNLIYRLCEEDGKN